jgi:cytochrome c556
MMKKAILIAVAAVMLPAALLAEDKAAIMKDMKAQEEAMAAIQKGLLYGSKEGVADGIKALKAANKIAMLKDNLVDYLPKEKKALHKTALKEGELVNKYADEMQKKLEKGSYSEAFTAYGKVLNSCNTCHLIIRNWK